MTGCRGRRAYGHPSNVDRETKLVISEDRQYVEVQ